MNSIIQRLQAHTVSIYHLTDDMVEEQMVDARSLLNPSRFDLFAKLYYIRHRKDNPTEANRVYREHIMAFNPDLKEPGREDKDGLDDFVSSFNQLIDHFESYDFNTDISLVPVTEDGVILDGAHRVAALAYYNKKVGIVRCKGVKPKAEFDFLYFKNRGLSWEKMDVIANEMARWISNCYVACLWPKMKNKSDALALIDSKFGIVYEKTLHVTLSSFKSLIRRVYEGQPWVNEPESVNDKSMQCYGVNGLILFIFFIAKNLEEVLTVKDTIRNMYDVGKHSLHITDSVEETRDIAEYILNDKKRKEWLPLSAVDGLGNRLKERWYIFKHVHMINMKVAIVKVLKIK